MRRLYFKLLAWFVAAFVAANVAQVLVVAARNPRVLHDLSLTAPDPGPFYSDRGEKIVGPLVDLPHSVALKNFLLDIESETGVQGMVWDGNGKRIAGGKPTPRALTMARAATEQVKLVQVREPNGTWLYSAQKLRSPQGRRFTLVMREVSDVSLTLPQGLAIAFGVQMLVCIGLARYIAAPAEKLRRATQRFADGDLSVRVAPQMGRRRDELADLGRDFDAMASRIQILLQSERRLLVDVSHELRSPLARQSAALELANEAKTEEVGVYLARIERENQRLNELINQLLMLTRMESGLIQLSMQPLDLSELVREVGEDLIFEGGAVGIAVETSITPGASILGDHELLRRALENVGRNALRYTNPQRGILLSLEKANEDWRVSVRDFGPGVPEALLSDIFQPFVRVHEARDHDSGGTGLGLAITQQSISLHGGQVEARNCHSEGGLLVEIFLPIPPVLDASP